MATLYDASLDVLRKHDWRFGLSFPRRAMYVRADFASAFQRLRMYGDFPITYPGEGFDRIYILESCQCGSGRNDGSNAIECIGGSGYS